MAGWGLIKEKQLTKLNLGSLEDLKMVLLVLFYHFILKRGLKHYYKITKMFLLGVINK